MIKIAPSILSSDFSRLGSEITRVLEAGADYIHIDVMDGHFVPNITIGLPVVASLRGICKAPLDVHLMIDAPHRYVERFIDAGADIVTIHLETGDAAYIEETLGLIKARGKAASLSLRPGTPAENILPFIKMLDMLLIMTVEPGFGGQPFIMDSISRIELLSRAIADINPACLLEVDGGIIPETSRLVRAAGANVLVAGTAVFGAADVRARIRELRGE